MSRISNLITQTYNNGYFWNHAVPDNYRNNTKLHIFQIPIIKCETVNFKYLIEIYDRIYDMNKTLMQTHLCIDNIYTPKRKSCMNLRSLITTEIFY